MDEKDIFSGADGEKKESLLADDISLDEPSDFVDEPTTEAPPSEKGENLYSADEDKADDKEKTPGEEEDMKEEKTADEDDDTPVIDESAPVPDAEEMNEALKPKLKETSIKKKKRIIIAVVAAVLIVAITLAIALPIYFVNKGKIFVKNAEDFANYNDGTYFVLEKDVTVDGDLTIDRLYNIDLNGHTLVVNGVLTLDSGTEGTLYIGTKKGKEYIAKGLLQADTLVISTANADVNLASSVTVNTMTVTAKTFTLSSSAQANGTVTVNAPTANINGSIAFGEGESAKFVANGASALNVNADVSSAVEINSTTMYLASNATIGSLAVDSASRAAIYGKVGNEITAAAAAQTPATATADEGEAQTAALSTVVLLGTDYSCPTVRNIGVLAIERRSGLAIDVYNCGEVKYIDRLASPVDVNIDERKDGSLVAVASKVQSAVSYSFSVDGGEWVTVDTNEYDITSQLTSQTGTHRIEVYAKGNYSYDAPFELGEGSRLYLDGSATACEYTYQIQLATPSNLNVSVSTVDGKQVYTLTFDKVAFATGYDYYVNGTKYTFRPETDDALVSIDVTDKLAGAGAYAIRVVATADSADILTSKAAMTSTVKIEKLNTPTLSATLQEDGRTLLTIQTTEGVSTTYTVTYNERKEDGTVSAVTLVTSNTTLYIEGLVAGDSVTVVAEASGYYTQSDASTVAVSAYVAPVAEQ